MAFWSAPFGNINRRTSGSAAADEGEDEDEELEEESSVEMLAVTCPRLLFGVRFDLLFIGTIFRFFWDFTCYSSAIFRFFWAHHTTPGIKTHNLEECFCQLLLFRRKPMMSRKQEPQLVHRDGPVRFIEQHDQGARRSRHPGTGGPSKRG